MSYHETRHTKKNIPLYVAALDERVEREEFLELKRKAKELGGRKKRPFFQAVERSLMASQKLISGDSSIKRDDVIESEYSLNGLNLDVNIPVLLKQLDAFNVYLKNDISDLRINMNMLFYGPPGTGKTEMSRYLSRHLKRELIVKRTSDILSKWVGAGHWLWRASPTQKGTLFTDACLSIETIQAYIRNFLPVRLSLDVLQSARK